MTKIIELHAENFKRLKVVDITPNGSTVVIGGRNAQGKTSTLDAIQAALAGGKHQPDQPIREGEKKAVIVVELDDIIVTRKYTKRGSKLEVVAKDGSKITSPQRVLDALASSLSFDPLAFSRCSPKEQGKVLRDLAGLDFTEIDANIERAFDDRRAKNAEKKRLDAVFASTTSHKDAPESEVLVSEMASKIEAYSHGNAVIETLRERHASLNDLLERLAAKVAETTAERDQVEKDIEEAGDIIDLAPLREKIENVERDNQVFREQTAYLQVKENVNEADKAATDADEKLLSLRAAKAKLIEDADYPVDGLSVDDDGVMLNGIALSQASGAELVRVSAAIGLALNPEMKVLLIRDGSLLDDDSMAALTQIATDADAQIWIERVGAGKEVGVVIEDGEVLEDRT